MVREKFNLKRTKFPSNGHLVTSQEVKMTDWGTVNLAWDNINIYRGKDKYDSKNLSDKTFRKYIEKNAQIIRKVEEIGLPQKGEQVRLISMHLFNVISIVDYISRKEKIIDAFFMIFSINQSAARLFIEMKKTGRIENIKFVISSIQNAGHKTKGIAIEMLEKYFPDIIYINSHAKISVLRTELDNHYVIEGSGNFSANGKVEQYVIDNDEFLYNFSKRWMKEIEQYKESELC